jgi:hypothetical protein
LGVLFVSSGRGTDVAAGVLWDEPGSGTEAGVSAETHAISGVVRSSKGVRKHSFEGSTSSGDETRRPLSVGDPSGFTVTVNSRWSEADDWDPLVEELVTEDLRPSAPLSAGTGVRGLDRFRLGRGGGGPSELGPGELVRSGGATKRRFSLSDSARLSLSFSPQPGTRSKPKEDATPQKLEFLVFLRGGTGGLSSVAPTISRRGGGTSGDWTASSQIFSRMFVRRKDQRVQVARSRAKHHPETQSGSAEGNPGESDIQNIYIWAGSDDVSWYGGGDGGAEEDVVMEDFLKIDDDQVLN